MFVMSAMSLNMLLLALGARPLGLHCAFPPAHEHSSLNSSPFVSAQNPDSSGDQHLLPAESLHAYQKLESASSHTSEGDSAMFLHTGTSSPGEQHTVDIQ